MTVWYYSRFQIGEMCLKVPVLTRVWRGPALFPPVMSSCMHGDVLTWEARVDLKLVTSMLDRKNSASNTVYIPCFNCSDPTVFVEWKVTCGGVTNNISWCQTMQNSISFPHTDMAWIIKILCVEFRYTSLVYFRYHDGWYISSQGIAPFLPKYSGFSIRWVNKCSALIHV